jgi:hypothetical protein
MCPDRFAIRLTEQISSIGLFAVTESQCTEDEHDDDDDEDDFKFWNLGLNRRLRSREIHDSSTERYPCWDPRMTVAFENGSSQATDCARLQLKKAKAAK